MRSAWSPTRSMSFETVFEVWPTRLLALPTVLATDFTSRSGRLGLAIERGTGTPRTFLRRGRLFSAIAPATPAAAAPTASAGPRALLAALLTVPTAPLPLWLFAGLRLAPLPLEREEPLLERDEALPEREALLRPRVDAEVFVRDDPPEERDEPLRDAPLAREEPLLAFVFDAERLDELLLLCPLREAGLLLAIPDSFGRGRPCVFGLPTLYADNRILLLCDALGGPRARRDERRGANADRLLRSARGASPRRRCSRDLRVRCLPHCQACLGGGCAEVPCHGVLHR